MFFDGDFNGKSHLWWPGGDETPEGRELHNMFTSLGLSQVISEPTNFDPGKKPACIDLIVTDQPNHGLLIEYGPICHIVKLPISMIRPFSLVNNSHITLYPQLEIIWKVSKSLRKYWEKYGQISFYITTCITRDCIIVENIFWAWWEISILTSTLPNIVKIASIVIEIWQKYS